MKRWHNMPFGAECQPGGGVRFRLWAPAAREVKICLWHAERCRNWESENAAVLPMQSSDDGWFELVTDRAAAGSGYKFQIDGGPKVPDPASRFQPHDVHGPSEVLHPLAFDWRDDGWRGLPWEHCVLYELHVGAFTAEGTFSAIEQRLDYLAELGVTAVELMPLSDFPGARNWGYDGVLPFAPDSSYGRPDELKHLVQCAHAKGLGIFLDVVYNHFGPEGNYLRAYAPQFFTGRHHTPWGEAINFDGPNSTTVREFFIHNALYWLTEYNFDGLRLDAVHAIVDDSSPDFLTTLAETVRRSIDPGRHVHLVLENDHNAARRLTRDATGRCTFYDAQWNDDIHHALHTAITGEKDGYYSDYADCPARHLGRCLTEGFDFQGQPSPYRHGMTRGESSRDLPLTAFVSFLQNHDQVGNRAFGERIGMLADDRAVRAAVTILLLAPSPPLLFMGEEFGATTPFLFFCDFGPDLAAAVTQGRRNEFARFAHFGTAQLATIPDPNALSTFESSRLDWNSLGQAKHQSWLHFYRELLQLRRREIVPRMAEIKNSAATFEIMGTGGLFAHWELRTGEELRLVANLSDQALSNPAKPAGRLLYASDQRMNAIRPGGILPAWFAAWLLKP